MILLFVSNLKKLIRKISAFLQWLPPVLITVSTAVIKHHLGEKRVYSDYASTSHFTEGSRDRILEARADAKATEGCSLLSCSMACSVYFFFIEPRATTLEMEPPTME